MAAIHAAAAYHVGPPRAIVYTLSNFTPEERAFVHAVLNDVRGWGGYGIRWALPRSGGAAAPVFSPLDAHGGADVIIEKTPRAAMRAMFGARPELAERSVTVRRRGDPVYIYIDADNWSHPPRAAPYGRDVEAYRRHLVLHEAGHALGLGHDTCDGRGAALPIMTSPTAVDAAGCVPRPGGWLRTDVAL